MLDYVQTQANILHHFYAASLRSIQVRNTRELGSVAAINISSNLLKYNLKYN